MPGAARLRDTVAGTTAGEHSGHASPCAPEAFSGEIIAGCWKDVRINGRPAATVGSVTAERDACCGSSLGSVAAGSASVFIHGIPAARLGDALNAHSGTGTVSSGSSDVSIGG